VAADFDVPVDGNPCTDDACFGGVPFNPPAAAATSCGGSNVCDGAGQCVGCNVATDCPGVDTECAQRACTVGVCGFTFALANLPLTNSGSASSEGALSLSGDGRFLVLAGYAAPPGTAGVAGSTTAAVRRVIGRIDAAGIIDTSSLLTTAFSANNVRSAASADGSGFWAAGAGGGTGGIWFIPLGAS